MKKLILTLLLPFLSICALAQDGIGYQAIVRDTDNALVIEEQVSIQVSLLAGGTEGEVIFSETHTPTTNNYGLLSIEIGQGTASVGVFDEIAWEDTTYFLKTEIDPTGGTDYTIITTSQLLSVPYALYSSEAGKLTTEHMIGTYQVTSRIVENTVLPTDSTTAYIGGMLVDDPALTVSIEKISEDVYSFDISGTSFTLEFDANVSGNNLSVSSDGLVAYQINGFNQSFDLLKGYGSVINGNLEYELVFSNGTVLRSVSIFATKI